ncbi:hypothetical protein [Luteitalea pratensis]|uniref:non-homologous end-joining DNA ligase LigD n=1 Tax=Luteitalea pratensis TaxID=1855912 RepID=UPI003AABCB0D
MPRKAARSSSLTVASVPISHPDRLIYPDQEISKANSRSISRTSHDWIVPHVTGRPLTLVHCPAGIASPCIYLKRAKQWGPNALRRVKVRKRQRSAST